MFTLETKRLHFRAFLDSDADSLLEMFSDPEVMRYAQGTWGADDIGPWLDKMRERSDDKCLGFRAGFCKDTGEYAGHMGLLRQEVEGESLIEVGYWLTKRQWGNGFAAEGARAFRNMGFEQLGVDKIVSLIHPDNVSSQKVATRNGMTLERTAIWRDMRVHVFAITRSEWEQLT